MLVRTRLVLAALTLALCTGCHWIASYDPVPAGRTDAPVGDGARADGTDSSSSDGATDGAIVDGDAAVSFESAWLKAIRSTGSVNDPRIAVNPVNDNIIMAWTFTIDVDAGDGKRLLTAASPSVQYILLAAYDGAGALLWKKHFGGTVRGLAVDGSGRVFLGGSFGGSVDFGGGLRDAGGGGGLFVASYDAQGNHRWSQAYGLDTLSETVTALAADPAGNVFMAGGPNRGQDFGGGALPTDKDEDSFLVSFDANGTHRWSRPIGGDGPRALDTEYIAALAVDEGTGDLIIVGNFDDTIDLGGGPLVSAGGDDVFIARFSNAGVHDWSKRFGEAAIDQVQALSVDGSGAIYLVGRYLSAIDFGGGPLPLDGFDTFLAALDGSGNHRWSRRLVTADTVPSLAVAADKSGDVYVIGDFTQPASLGGPLIDLGTGSHVFIASYTSGGAHRFSTGFGSVPNVAKFAINTFGDDQVITAGSFGGTLSVGGEDITAEATLNGFLLFLRL